MSNTRKIGSLQRKPHDRCGAKTLHTMSSSCGWLALLVYVSAVPCPPGRFLRTALGTRVPQGATNVSTSAVHRHGKGQASSFTTYCAGCAAGRFLTRVSYAGGAPHHCAACPSGKYASRRSMADPKTAGRCAQCAVCEASRGASLRGCGGGGGGATEGPGRCVCGAGQVWHERGNRCVCRAAGYTASAAGVGNSAAIWLNFRNPPPGHS